MTEPLKDRQQGQPGRPVADRVFTVQPSEQRKLVNTISPVEKHKYEGRAAGDNAVALMFLAAGMILAGLIWLN